MVAEAPTEGQGQVRVEDVHVAATGSWLPPARGVSAAVRAGELGQDEAGRLGLASVCVSDAVSAPEMAARAGRRAVARAGHAAETFAAVLHAASHRQGPELWSAAAYVQAGTIGGVCPAVEVRQVCNAGMAALELGVARLLVEPGKDSVLITAADRFPAPGFDRWHSDPGTAYGDGGAALVLSRRTGPLRLLSVVTESDPELEGMHRDDALAESVAGVDRRVEVAAARAAFTRRMGADFVVSRIVDGQRRAVRRALADADTTMDAISLFVLPNLGVSRMRAFYFRSLRIAPERSTWAWGRTVGHLGAADQFAALDRCVAGTGRKGARYLLLGAGNGFSWSAAVLQATC
ncbi:ketoacyl-ACP synthase III family protein [Streptomyces sp. NPDC002644]